MTADDIPANGGGATTQKPLKWGIMGCGMISNDFVHAVLRNGKQPHIIHAVATANSPERAQQFVQKLQVPDDAKAQIKAYGSYDEMLADPEIEVVYVGILNQTHCPWVCACLERGKNVLCEKPMGQSRAETEKIAAKAREKGLFVMEALWSRFFPVWRQLRAVLDKKQFGAVKQIQATFGTLLPSNRFDVSISECPAVDIGIYCVQFAMFCMDDQQPSVIKAHAVKNADGVDICGQFCLEFGGEGEKAKARASLLYNTEVPCPNSAFVAFEKGIFEIRESFYCPTRARIIKGKPFGQDMDMEELNFPLADNDQSIYNFPNSSGLHFEADHVFECLHSNLKESPVAGLEASLRIASILEEIRRQIGIKFPAQDDSADKCCQDSSAEKCCQ